MADDPIEVNPTPPVEPAPTTVATAEELNEAVTGRAFGKFFEHEGGMGVSFDDGAFKVYFNGVDDISVE